MKWVEMKMVTRRGATARPSAPRSRREPPGRPPKWARRDQDFRLVDHRYRQRRAWRYANGRSLGSSSALLQVEAPEHSPTRAGMPSAGRWNSRACNTRSAAPQLGIRGKGLGHVADPATGRHVVSVHRLAEQRARAFAGRQQAGEHLHGGGLAAAVGAEKAEDFPTLDTEADVIDRDEVAETTGSGPRPRWRSAARLRSAVAAGSPIDGGRRACFPAAGR